MKGKNIWKVIFALVVITVLAFGSVALYRLGFSHGAMTNITLPEGSDFSVMPYAHRPLGWNFGPRVGLMGIFPLLCLGGFFFLVLMFGFGFMARKSAWMRYGPGANPDYWQHHGPPHWGPGRPPWEQEKTEADSESSSVETDGTEG